MRPPKVTIDKLGAVVGQIDTAIWLWVKEGDVVSIFQLTGAALGVLDGIFQQTKFGRRPFPFDEKDAPKGITPRQARNLIKGAENSAKHARKPNEKTYDYRFDKATDYLYYACVAYFKLTGDHGSRLQELFRFRYGIFHPNLFPPSTLQSVAERAEVQRLKQLTRIEFFQEGGEDLTNPPSFLDWPDDHHSALPSV